MEPKDKKSTGREFEDLIDGMYGRKDEDSDEQEANDTDDQGSDE